MADNDEMIPPPDPATLSRDELIKLIDEEERSYLRRIIDMCKGLKQPKDSLDFKKAMIELQRLGAPIAAVLLMVSVITIMSVIKITVDEKPPPIETIMVEPEEAEQLEEPPEEPPPPPEDPPELDEVVDTEVVVDIDAPPSPSAEQSPAPSPVDAVAITPSPVVMKGVYASRSTGLRGAKIGSYGLQGTEKLVYGFLRWLKKNQKPNGMWDNGGASTGATSLALLCFLAHGELPGSSPEFGDTVQKAIQGLLNDQIKTQAECKPGGAENPTQFESRRKDKIGYFKGRDSHNYAHLVAVYALSEAYAMTRIPDIKDALDLAIPHITDGQNADGGWYYNMYAACPITDTSFTSWAVQGLKAAKLAHAGDQAKVVTALKKAARGIKTCWNDQGNVGFFGYTTQSGGSKRQYPGLTSACALILQMLDESDTDICRKAIAYMDSWEPAFKKNFKASTSSAIPMAGASPQYYCYYLSQVRFNLGEKHPAWLRWSNQQKRLYLAAAINIPAEKSGYKDHEGKPQYITFWPQKGGKSKYAGENAAIPDDKRLEAQPGTRNGTRNGYPIADLVNVDSAAHDWTPSAVVANCFTALQLMVYYRNSPLAKGALTSIEAETAVEVKEETGGAAGEVTLEGIDDL